MALPIRFYLTRQQVSYVIMKSRHVPQTAGCVDSPRVPHGCEMVTARFLYCMCLALRASGLWLRYAMPPPPPPWRNARKGRDPSGNLDLPYSVRVRVRPPQREQVSTAARRRHLVLLSSVLVYLFLPRLNLKFVSTYLSLKGKFIFLLPTFPS